MPHQEFRATYRQLWDQVSLAARGLLARGVAKGDRVGIWSPNRFEWVVVQYATARIGAILVNINPAYRTSELEYALRQSGVSLLLLARAFRRPTTWACSMRSEARVPTFVRHSCSRRAGSRCSETARRCQRMRSPLWRASCSSTTRSTSSTRRAPPDFPRARRCRTTTSSTTASSSARRCSTPRPIASASPCRSITASAWCSATSPAPRTARASSSPARRSKPDTVLRVTEEERCTSLYGVPTMFIAELEHPGFAQLRSAACCAPGSWPARRARSR